MVLPAYAFFSGHPFRMRYMVAPSVGAAVFAGIALGMLKGRWRHAAAVAIAVWLVATVKPIDAQAPMVQEAQWDVPFSLGRRNVTACLMREYRGERILASMGSLAHYMQELSHAGINIRDFVHEGTLPYWQEAIEAPQGPRRMDSGRGARRGRGHAGHARPRVVRIYHRLRARVRGRWRGALQS